METHNFLNAWEKETPRGHFKFWTKTCGIWVHGMPFVLLWSEWFQNCSRSVIWLIKISNMDWKPHTRFFCDFNFQIFCIIYNFAFVLLNFDLNLEYEDFVQNKKPYTVPEPLCSAEKLAGTHILNLIIVWKLLSQSFASFVSCCFGLKISLLTILWVFGLCLFNFLFF